jgi:hypothetical protein
MVKDIHDQLQDLHQRVAALEADKPVKPMNQQFENKAPVDITAANLTQEQDEQGSKKKK